MFASQSTQISVILIILLIIDWDHITCDFFDQFAIPSERVCNICNQFNRISFARFVDKSDKEDGIPQCDKMDKKNG